MRPPCPHKSRLCQCHTLNNHHHHKYRHYHAIIDCCWRAFRSPTFTRGLGRGTGRSQTSCTYCMQPHALQLLRHVAALDQQQHNHRDHSPPVSIVVSLLPCLPHFAREASGSTAELCFRFTFENASHSFPLPRSRCCTARVNSTTHSGSHVRACTRTAASLGLAAANASFCDAFDLLLFEAASSVTPATLHSSACATPTHHLRLKRTQLALATAHHPCSQPWAWLQQGTPCCTCPDRRVSVTF